VIHIVAECAPARLTPRLQLDSPQVDRTCPDCYQRQGASKPSRILQGQEVPAPRPPRQEDPRDPPAVDQGLHSLYSVKHDLILCAAREGAQDGKAAQEEHPLPAAQVRRQGHRMNAPVVSAHPLRHLLIVALCGRLCDMLHATRRSFYLIDSFRVHHVRLVAIVFDHLVRHVID